MPKNTHTPPLVENPRALVHSCANRRGACLTERLPGLDAIYVPFKDRFANVRGLLRELKHYEGPIYLLSTGDCRVDYFGNSLRRNVHLLSTTNRSPLKEFYGRLRTSNHPHIKGYLATWDLPLKRNYAIQHALTNGYERILLVDDDIRSITKECIAIGSRCLKKYVMAGCFVDDFVDTSVMGHLEYAAGDPVYPFLSGSFLLLRPWDIEGFFPCVYNEDWLFMVPHILDRSICSYGSVGQLQFNPFDSATRSVFQEFGDLFVDGLYALLAGNQYERRYDMKAWDDLITERREFMLSLSDRLPGKGYQRIIGTMLNVSRNITPKDCLLFMGDWEKDLISWQKYIQSFK